MFTKPFALVFAAAAVVSALDIETPGKLTQCDTVEIKWSGAKAPFTLAVLPGCESGSEDPLIELAPMNATSYQWTVNLPSSTGVVAFAIVDNEGNEAYTDEVTVQNSDNAACLSAASSTAASSVASTASETPAVTSTEDPSATRMVSETYASTATAAAPVNIGSSGSSVSNPNTGANSAIAPVASAFAGMIGVATALFALL